MKHPGRYPYAAGFTLLELMVAVAILGLIMVTLAGSFHAIAAGKTQAENRLAAEQQARSILWQISNEIRGAVATPNLPSHVLMIGRGQMQNNVPLDSLTMSTLDPGHRRSIEGFGPEDIVAYSASAGLGRRGQFSLARSQASGLSLSGLARNSSVVLTNSLLSLHFRYFDGNIWTESWNSQALPPGRQLPQAVSIDLAVASTGSPVRLSTVVTLPMAFAQW
ncbi:MAG TPA: prepilin-type N-terminal cleavage/methylation domain-containing protein [Candidatus Binataceae bacterium]|nr:prepilin-type N-terminal cleavage/methylation domain-containing protein [Candidatus Binataceae bacterium]